MPKPLIRRTKKLEELSSGSKVGVQLMWLAILIVLPRLFPDLIILEHPFSLTLNIFLALATSLFYEGLRLYLQNKGKDIRFVLKAQLLTSVVLLVWFLHVFGRINGPFFPLFLLTMMESALNLTPGFVNLVSGIMIGATVSEYLILAWQGEIILELYTVLQVFIRLVSLFFMRSYAVSLADRIISEQSAKHKVQETAARLKKLSNELEGANAKLKELSVLKDEFVSVASHELRAPMTTIKGYVSMVLEGDTGKVGTQTRRYLENAYEGNERMIRLVNNMLNVSRIESGRLVINLADVQLEESIAAVVAEFQIEAQQKNLKLAFKKPAKSLPLVRVDPDRIREVIGNLVGNALKFTEKGSVTINCRLEKSRIVTEVADTGPGISLQNQEKLFQKFSQVGDQSEVTQKGSGLGLYICRNLVEDFGGKIWLESEVGQGTSFFFSLPVIKS